MSRALAQEMIASLNSVPRRGVRIRRYVVNATLMLGAVPLFTKACAGGALLSIEEAGSGACGSVGLQFGAGTWPERIRGFNRFGMTQETVRLEHGAIAETAYMSFMTASREANFSQAEKAFRSRADCLPVTIAHGRSTASGSTGGVLHDAVDAGVSWADCPKLIDQLRARTDLKPENVSQQNSGAVLPTFLYAVRQAVLRNERKTAAGYTHNGEIYRLRTEAREERSGKLIITARTSRLGVRGESEFKLWVAPGADADLPDRIEFRAKSYLKLTLETDERQNGLAFKPLF